ncbi:MAG: TlpA disulfide reductase family protein [Bacteroidota bacterium]|nr:TlpA disulfide reductase family protein [Bacteroidota bacterium]
MSRKFGLILIGIILFAGCRNKTAEITGILENPVPREYIFLQELKSNELLTVDSAMISDDGRFDFKREVKTPSFFLLKINQNNFLTMLIGPGEKIKMTSHNDSLNYPVAVIGSKGTKLMADYNKTMRKTVSRISALSNIYNNNLQRTDLNVLIDSLDKLAQGYLDELNRYTKNYIDDNLSSLVCLVALYQQISPGVYVLNPKKDIRYFKKVDSSLYSQYPEYDPVVLLHQQVQQLVGNGESDNAPFSEAGKEAVAPEIALPSPQGDTIKLSSTRGSIVLLDFWASWCSPCRIENPNLVKAYALYHSKGFKIYQVSLDKTRDAWIKGIQEDKLDKWIHVSDVKYWNSAVVPLYKIESIPLNFLLDKEGRIIASNLRGDALQRKLAEVFK